MSTTQTLEQEYNRKTLMGIGLETAFGTLAAPTLFLPKSGIDIIQNTQELIQADIGVGSEIRPETNYSVLGIKKGSVKWKIPELPFSAAVAHLFAQMFAKITTTTHIAPNVGAFTHSMDLLETVGLAKNMDVGLSLAEWDGKVRRTLAGCRIVGFEYNIEHGKPASLDLDIEGAAYAEDATAVSPAITLNTLSPFVQASQLQMVMDEASLDIISAKVAVKFKHTADDAMQPIKSVAARSKIDLVQVDDIALTIKRHLLRDGDDMDTVSKFLESYRERTVHKEIALPHTSLDLIVPGGNLYWKFDIDIAGVRIEKEDDIKQSVVGGAMIEEITFHAVKVDGEAIMGIVCINDSADPESQNVA